MKNEVTIADLNLALMQNNLAAQKLILASQVRTAQNAEKQSEAELDKTVHEMGVCKRIADRGERQSLNYLRPSFQLKPVLEKSGEGWLVRYGELVARGESPEIACQEFDHMWVGKDEL
jgi:hypothetical protein